MGIWGGQRVDRLRLGRERICMGALVCLVFGGFFSSTCGLGQKDTSISSIRLGLRLLTHWLVKSEKKGFV